MTITIRPARPDERFDLMELQRRASLNNPGDREAILAHPDAIDLPADQIEDGHAFVAQIDGRTVGFAVVLPRDDGQAELDGLFVDPAAQRNGAGRALVDHGCALARQRGATALHVVGNYHAQEFYAAAGFIQTGTFETQFGQGMLLKRTL